MSMCRKNLKMAQNLVAQTFHILGMYSDNYFVKLPRRVARESGLEWVQRTLSLPQKSFLGRLKTINRGGQHQPPLI